MKTFRWSDIQSGTIVFEKQKTKTKAIYPFYRTDLTPWKHQKTFGFMMYSGGRESDKWYEMSLKEVPTN